MPAPLKRSMRVMGVLLLTLSGVTPASSVFIGVPEVISEAGTGALISMIIGALLAAPIACVYAELSSAFPIAGGEYALVGRTLGPAPGFAILGLTVAVNMLSPAVLALGVAANLRPILPGLDPTWTAEAILVATTLLGVLHIRTNAWVTGVFLFLELAALGVLTTLGFLHAQNPLGGFLAHPVVLSNGGFHPASAAAIGLSVSVAIFVYNGFGSAVYFAEEMHEAPKLVARTILWAGLISVLTVLLPLVAVLAGCKPPPERTTGWARKPPSGLWAWAAPSAVSRPRAASSRKRKTPVTQALVRMCSTPRRVVAARIAWAVQMGSSPGKIGLRLAATPSASTAGDSMFTATVRPRMAKPGAGPSVRPTRAYSPPAIGKAEESSA